MRKKSLTVADFFCGAGGFSEGFRQKGFDVVFALDNWLAAKQTHDLNHPNCHCELMNILELDTPEKIDAVVPDVDIIIGSPPCVSFSGSNKAGKADKTLGIQLIESYLRIVAWKLNKGAAKYWIMENVPNSSNFVKDRYTWKELGLPGKGKDLIIPVRRMLNAAEYGAPQTRKRFVCGNYPEPTKVYSDAKSGITMRDVLKCLSNPLASNYPKKITDPVYGFNIDSDDLTDHFYDSTVADYEWQRAKRLKEDHGFMGKMSFPENLDRSSRTVMATMSASTRESIIFSAIKGKSEVGYRLPTIREIACFMSFPITYQFEGSNESNKYRLVGNAVCCKLSAALAEAIAKERGIKSQAYMAQEIRKASVSLNNTKRAPKIPKSRKSDAKFSIHIPYLKIKSFRVELTNKSSDFKKGKVIWECLIHYGSGKNAKFAHINQDELERILTKDSSFLSFKKAAQKRFVSFNKNAKQLQQQYVLNGNARGLTPEKALELMQRLIDKHYPQNEYGDKFFETARGLYGIERPQIPFRILAGAYLCNYFVSLMKS